MFKYLQRKNYKGGYFLSDMESASEAEDDDEQYNKKSTRNRNISKNQNIKKTSFSIGFGHPSAR